MKTTWRDVRSFPLDFIRDRDLLAITSLTLIPWLILLIRNRDLNSLQPLTWIFGFIAFYWLIGHQQTLTPVNVRKPRLELFIALVFVAVWIIYRIGEYGHWYVVPTFGLNNSCGPISETPLPKMLEMFLLPLIFLLLLQYSLAQTGFRLDKFSWLAALLPLIVLVAFGFVNHGPQTFAISSACYFFGAGLPEEFLFRAFLQTRLEAILRRPLWAVWLGSFIFGLTHIPIDLAGNINNWQYALLTAFTYQMTVGFVLGYAYMHTRSLLPLSLIHTLIDFVF
ncbi:MAG TPA: CPBP family intramembrane glutamic endopeptidase [Anaerolineales bacterium]